MAVTAVKEDYSLREASVDKHFRYRAKRGFNVQTSVETDDASIIMGAVGPDSGIQVPFITQYHPTIPSIVALDIDFKPSSKSPCFWIVVADYGPGTGSVTQITDPCSIPMTYDWTFNLSSQTVFYANLDIERMKQLNGVQADNSSYLGPFDNQYASQVPTNSAGQPTQCTDDTTVIAVVCTHNERRFSPYWASLYANTVNNSPVFGCPKGTALIYSITAQEQFDQNRKLYYTVRYEIHFKDTWNIDFVDQGTYQAIAVLGHTGMYNLRPIWDSNNSAYTTGPVLLDGTGRQAIVPSASGYVNVASVPAPKYRSYQIKGWKDWGALGIDQQWQLNQQ